MRNMVKFEMSKEISEKKGNQTRTFSLKFDQIENKCFSIDATGLSLGRVASTAAKYLKGKHKATFTPNLLCGDKVIIYNIDNIVLTGKKTSQKIYYSHSGYLGGLKERSYEYVREKDPIFPLRKAVERMLSSGPLRKRMLRMLYLFENAHNMQAQSPIEIGGTI